MTNPMKPEAPPSGGPGAHPPCGAVLVAFENPHLRAAVRASLAEVGYDARAADTLDAAAALLRESEEACLVLSEYRPPRMDAWSLLRQMQREPGLARHTVVIATAERRRPELPALKVRLLKRPFLFEDLLAIIREFCGTPDRAR